MEIFGYYTVEGTALNDLFFDIFISGSSRS